jgi:hypothetical protein
MQLFATRTALDPTDPAVPLEAYKEGRRDERRQILEGGPEHRVVKKELEDAYERGRREERARKRLSPLGAFSFLLLVVLVIGGAILVFHYGSFSAAGSAIDSTLASIA